MYEQLSKKIFQLFQEKNLMFLNKGILGEKKIKVAEFWIKIQKVGTFFLLTYAYMWYKKRWFPETLQTSKNGYTENLREEEVLIFMMVEILIW